jgi:hypothetical protein
MAVRAGPRWGPADGGAAGRGARATLLTRRPAPGRAPTLTSPQPLPILPRPRRRLSEAVVSENLLGFLFAG